ncbi:hypothetical protein, partial [Thiolapillus sp.]
FASPLALCARRVSSAASRLLGTTSLRFALHGWQQKHGDAGTRRIVQQRGAHQYAGFLQTVIRGVFSAEIGIDQAGLRRLSPTEPANSCLKHKFQETNAEAFTVYPKSGQQ